MAILGIHGEPLGVTRMCPPDGDYRLRNFRKYAKMLTKKEKKAGNEEEQETLAKDGKIAIRGADAADAAAARLKH